MKMRSIEPPNQMKMKLEELSNQLYRVDNFPIEVQTHYNANRLTRLYVNSQIIEYAKEYVKLDSPELMNPIIWNKINTSNQQQIILKALRAKPILAQIKALRNFTLFGLIRDQDDEVYNEAKKIYYSKYNIHGYEDIEVYNEAVKIYDSKYGDDSESFDEPYDEQSELLDESSDESDKSDESFIKCYLGFNMEISESLNANLKLAQNERPKEWADVKRTIDDILESIGKSIDTEDESK